MFKAHSLKADPFPFLQRGGEMGELTRAFDWSKTPVGAPGQWPESLRVTVGLILSSKFPMFLWWGPDMIQFYNDAYRPSLGNEGKHPKALGQRGEECWPEIWDIIYPLIRQVQTTGEATWSEDQLVPIYRNGRIEDVYWTFSYSPVWGTLGEVCGVLVVCTETTEKVFAKKELERSAGNLRNMILQAPVAMCMLTGEQHIIEVANQRIIEIWGKPEDDVLGKPVFQALPDARGQGLEQIMDDVYRTGKTFTASEMPVSLVRNGTQEIIYLSFVYQPYVDSEGNIAGIIAITTDITEHVLAKKELQRFNRELSRAYENFRNLILQAPVAMALFLGERMVIDVINDRFLELWDRDSSVIGKPVIEALPEMEGQPYPQIMLDVFNSGETYYANEASVFLKRKGKLDEGFYNFINQAFRDGEGNIIGLVAVAHEVTEQVVARRKLEKLNADLATSESRLRVAIDATGLGTWDYELLTESLYLSDEFRLIAGIDREEAVSFSKFMEQVHPEDMEVILKWFKPSTPDDTGRFDIKYRIYRFNDHEMRWVNVKGIALFGPDGKPSRFTGTILDITEERLAEEKSLRLAAIVTSSDDAIISKTLDGIVTSWNAAAERMFGYTEAEMIGENILKIIPNDRKEEEPRIQERLRRGEPVDHFETQRLTKAGKLLDVSLTISPLKNSDGKIIGASKIARDISEQKRDEQRKNDFIGMVSHELKTPLTSLTAILQFAGMKLKKTDDKPLQNAMTRANVQVKRMTSMINGFLNVSRLESGKMHLEKRWFNLDELVREIVEETRLLVTSNEIIWAECQRTPVFADYDKISSVISNLISNAVKYSGNAEPITVSCQTVEGNATVSVADRGVGIKAEDLERVFERYYRIETELARQVSGFGIGLYLSAEIVRRHGGEIWAESALGEGSTFYFTLPEKDPNTGKE
jgi:hypothetical protein